MNVSVFSNQWWTRLARKVDHGDVVGPGAGRTLVSRLRRQWSDEGFPCVTISSGEYLIVFNFPSAGGLWGSCGVSRGRTLEVEPALLRPHCAGILVTEWAEAIWSGGYRTGGDIDTAGLLWRGPPPSIPHLEWYRTITQQENGRRGECAECGGTGNIMLFVSKSPCSTCGTDGA